ncbi:MAG: endopeptidase La [Deltaproteobacteria bacterium]|nr:endopeptidase La [Deltaproteobacteria bacterium]
MSPDEQQAVDAEKSHIPSQLPILPLTNFVVFPHAIGPISVKNASYARMINEAAVRDRFLGLTLIRSQQVDTPDTSDLCMVGTAARIIKLMNTGEGEVSFICQGIARMQIDTFIQKEPYITAEVRILDEEANRSDELDAMLDTLRNQFARLVDASPQLSDQLKIIAATLNDYARIIDFSVANSSSDAHKQQEVLEERQIRERFRKALGIIQTEIQKMDLSNKIQSEIAEEFGQRQREHLLREQLKKIQAELGDKDDQQVEIEGLRARIKEARLSAEAEKAAIKEVERLAMMSPAAAEYSVSRTYIDWLTGLPWDRATEDNLDILSVEKVLHEDHYDLEKIKKRIVEYVAVRKLKKDMKGPILCFYGPPGVGKTSLGRSIARALGRTFIRVSLGGVRDEAEIRGHRRTYVGALPGRIIQNMKKAGSTNPVFMLDEIDKLGMDFRGDPSSALLEVLDPEQNHAFSDHYLEVPFDLSNVFFITTANVIDVIPAALRDRLEVLELPGYTELEKLHIARAFLVQRQLAEHGLTEDNLTISDDAIRLVIQEYTREAGVRNLEREIAAIFRGVARKVAEGSLTHMDIGKTDVPKFLGQQKYFSDIAERITMPGIATGLAWTPSGGDILFVEATKMDGAKGLIITGQLGDVMKESAQAALSYVRSNARELGIRPDFYKKMDIHLHIPEGAISKDGPSAGIPMACALTSMLTGKLVRSDIAMTGEITLRGKVLPIGGLKEKVLAAKRAGITTVILPRLNKKDLDETPDVVKADMTFVFVDRIDEAIKAALVAELRPAGKKTRRKPVARKQKAS